MVTTTVQRVVYSSNQARVTGHRKSGPSPVIPARGLHLTQRGCAGYVGAPVALVGRVEAHVGDVAGVQAGKALDLVRKAAVLVARLQQLPPHVVEALVVLRQQRAVLLPHLQGVQGEG